MWGSSAWLLQGCDFCLFYVGRLCFAKAAELHTVVIGKTRSESSLLQSFQARRARGFCLPLRVGPRPAEGPLTEVLWLFRCIFHLLFQLSELECGWEDKIVGAVAAAYCKLDLSHRASILRAGCRRDLKPGARLSFGKGL